MDLKRAPVIGPYYCWRLRREWKLAALGVFIVFRATTHNFWRPHRAVVPTILTERIDGFGGVESRLHPGTILLRLTWATGARHYVVVPVVDVGDCRVGDWVRVRWTNASPRLLPGGCVVDRDTSAFFN